MRCQVHRRFNRACWLRVTRTGTVGGIYSAHDGGSALWVMVCSTGPIVAQSGRGTGPTRRAQPSGGLSGIVAGVQQVMYAVGDNHAVWAGMTLRAWADVLVDTLVKEFDPVSIILFGSVAAGSDGPDSDIDLLIVLDEAPLAGRRRKMVELRRATRSIAAPHDLLVTSAADFARNATRPGSTEYEPATHGVAVYERVAA